MIILFVFYSIFFNIPPTVWLFLLLNVVFCFFNQCGSGAQLTSSSEVVKHAKNTRRVFFFFFFLTK